METSRLRKSVNSLQDQERSLSLEYEDTSRRARRDEEARVLGAPGSTEKEDVERQAIRELKRVEGRVKVLARAVGVMEELKSFEGVLKDIKKTQGEIRVAEKGVRGLVGKKGIVKGIREVREGNKSTSRGGI
jgi:hypothetical protein